jgi:hypothetical protein
MVNRVLTSAMQLPAMRLVLLVLMSLALAAPAGAQDGGRIRGGGAESTPTLRGPVGGTPGDGTAVADSALASMVPLPPPVAPVGTLPRADARQCRQSCNRDYYFCLSAEEDICAPAWTQCTARCGQR